MKSILVVGKNGQVGSFLMDLFKAEPAGYKVLGIDQDQFNMSKPETLVPILEKLNPDILINAAAYTNVAKAEEETQLAEKINSEAPAVMAHWCKTQNKLLIHYSTDYVLPGHGDRPQLETELTGPLNAYGKTKLAGEKAVLKAGGLVLRSSWIFSERGNNFFLTMLKLAAIKDELKIVNDQIGAPTSALDLAEATIKIVKMERILEANRGQVFNICNSGQASWFEFTQKIIKMAGQKGMKVQVKNLIPITTDEYGGPVKRPLNSRLSTEKLKKVWGIELNSWFQALRECFDRLERVKR